MRKSVIAFFARRRRLRLLTLAIRACTANDNHSRFAIYVARDFERYVESGTSPQEDRRV